MGLRVGEKFYVYMKEKTIILSFQFNASGLKTLQNDRNEILGTLKIE